MKIIKIAFMGIVSLLALAGCGNAEGEKDATTILEESTVGFEMANGKIEEAQNVPQNDKDAIIAAFEEYMDAFNAKDIERYIATLSHDPKGGINIEDERKRLISTYEIYDVERVAEDVTITKYSESKAEVVSTLKTDLVEKETGANSSFIGRQVTVFEKEEEAWKISRTVYMGLE